MPFNSIRDVERRLNTDPSPLTAEEIRDLIPWMAPIGPGGIRRLEAELVLQTIQAVQKFGKSSSRLTRWLIVLTVVLVGLTAVITCFTILLSRSATP